MPLSLRANRAAMVCARYFAAATPSSALIQKFVTKVFIASRNANPDTWSPTRDLATRRAKRFALLSGFFFAILITSALHAHGPETRRVPDTIEQRVQACTVCHGKEGRATNYGYFPRIAGKPAGYLYNQLVNFREGRRHYAAMNRLLEYLSDDYLREIAQHFASVDVPYPPPAPDSATQSLLTLGERLAHDGDRARGIPACVQCHDLSLTGVAPNVPGLVGLPRDYLNAQLGAWRNAQRRAAAPDCMAKIANALTPDEISAITAWIASRPVPPHAKPALRFSQQSPLPCGSIDSADRR